MPIDTVEIDSSLGDKLTVTLSGKPEEIVKVLVHGMPREALLQIDAAMRAELQKRDGK